MRWRKASPRRPPDAKLRRTLRKFECSDALLMGMKKRMKKGAALTRSVEERA